MKKNILSLIGIDKLAGLVVRYARALLFYRSHEELYRSQVSLNEARAEKIKAEAERIRAEGRELDARAGLIKAHGLTVEQVVMFFEAAGLRVTDAVKQLDQDPDGANRLLEQVSTLVKKLSDGTAEKVEERTADELAPGRKMYSRDS